MKLPQLIVQILKMLLLLLKPLTNTHTSGVQYVDQFLPLTSPYSNLTRPVCFIDILIPISPLPSGKLKIEALKNPHRESKCGNSY